MIEPQAHRVSVDGTAVGLAPKEYELLYFLALHPNETFSREDLLSRVWNDLCAGFPYSRCTCAENQEETKSNIS